MTTQQEEIKELKQEIKEQKQEVKKTEQKLKKVVNTLRLETKKQIVIALLAGFGFLMALVWRDLLQEIANWIVVNSHVAGPAMLIKTYVAIITTIIAVIGIIIITKWNKEPQNNQIPT
ncbi:MAG: DUF5654 family protein [Candidatus Pacearchaeota archaeon]